MIRNAFGLADKRVRDSAGTHPAAAFSYHPLVIPVDWCQNITPTRSFQTLFTQRSTATSPKLIFVTCKPCSGNRLKQSCIMATEDIRDVLSSYLTLPGAVPEAAATTGSRIILRIPPDFIPVGDQSENRAAQLTSAPSELAAHTLRARQALHPTAPAAPTATAAVQDAQQGAQRPSGRNRVPRKQSIPVAEQVRRRELARRRELERSRRAAQPPRRPAKPGVRALQEIRRMQGRKQPLRVIPRLSFSKVVLLSAPLQELSVSLPQRCPCCVCSNVKSEVD